MRDLKQRLSRDASLPRFLLHQFGFVQIGAERRPAEKEEWSPTPVVELNGTLETISSDRIARQDNYCIGRFNRIFSNPPQGQALEDGLLPAALKSIACRRNSWEGLLGSQARRCAKSWL